MKWFKFYGQDYLCDPKILALSASERSCWITLLSYGSVNDNGVITYLNEEQLMMQAGVSPTHEEWESTKGILERLVRMEMIQYDNGLITIINWLKRQETNLTGYERVKRHRQKKQNDNKKITLDKIRVDKIRVDKIRKEENRIDKNITIESTPSQNMKDFLDNPERIIFLLREKGGDENIIRREISKFISYWTEQNKSGTKERWELQQTFDVKRRLGTWFDRVKDIKTDNKYQIKI